MHLSPMATFEQRLGASRFEALRESAYDSDSQFSRLEETIKQQRIEIDELKSEAAFAARVNRIMLERVAHAEGH